MRYDFDIILITLAIEVDVARVICISPQYLMPIFWITGKLVYRHSTDLHAGVRIGYRLIS